MTWRQHGPGWGEGQVTLVFATPGYEGSALYPGPEAPTANQTADYKVDPGSWDDVAAERGMWVIGAKTTVEVFDTTDWVDASFDPPGPGPKVTWRYPTSRQVSSGPVLTIRPSEVDGGVRNTARRYVP